MLKIVVCIKQVSMVSELPLNPKSGTLKRELAEGMMNPACAHALEAALQIKTRRVAEIAAISMGPPMVEEVLYEVDGTRPRGIPLAFATLQLGPLVEIPELHPWCLLFGPVGLALFGHVGPPGLALPES